MLGKPFVYPLSPSDGRIVIDQNDMISRKIFLRGGFESEVVGVISKLLRPGMVFFDVGANIGVFSIIASKIVGPSGQVHSFEPDPLNFRRLVNNIRENNAINIRANRIALMDREGTVALRSFAKNGLGAFSSVGEPVARKSLARIISQPVTSSTLQRYASGMGIRRIDVMKVDVEGAELMVLKGGEKLLRVTKAPAIICEFNASAVKALKYDLQELRYYIESLGYAIFRITDNYGHLTRIGENLEIPNYANLVAIKA